MNKDLIVFVREAYQQVDAIPASDFTDALGAFTFTVDVIGTQKADEWFESHEKEAGVIKGRYDAYLAKLNEAKQEDVTPPATKKAQGVMESLNAIRADVQALLAAEQTEDTEDDEADTEDDEAADQDEDEAEDTEEE